MSDVILKAFNGDRHKNIESIADKIDEMLNGGKATKNYRILSTKTIHQIRGYMEQLRIIAGELETK